mgnify:CR=1 FL=1
MRLRVEGMLLNARLWTHALRGEALELDCVSGECVRVRWEELDRNCVLGERPRVQGLHVCVSVGRHRIATACWGKA